MILTLPYGEEEISFRVPPTTTDVLEWTVWILCMEDAQAQIACALQWLGRWVESHTVDALAQLLDLHGIVEVCSAIAASAGAPASVLDGLAMQLDRENGVPHTVDEQGVVKKWTPKSTVCACARCRRGVAVADQPCVYDGLDPRILPAARHVSDATDVSAPYYVTQIRAVMSAAEGRRIGYQREQDEIKAKHHAMHAAIGGR